MLTCRFASLVARYLSAFNGAAVATRAQSSSAMKMSFENELGAQPPLGFWDPLYWLEDADQERFDRLRYVEIKHGRICMLAILGHITQENVRLPGNLNFETPFADMPNGLTAISKVRAQVSVVLLWGTGYGVPLLLEACSARRCILFCDGGVRTTRICAVTRVARNIYIARRAWRKWRLTLACLPLMRYCCTMSVFHDCFLNGVRVCPFRLTFTPDTQFNCLCDFVTCHDRWAPLASLRSSRSSASSSFS